MTPEDILVQAGSVCSRFEAGRASTTCTRTISVHGSYCSSGFLVIHLYTICVPNPLYVLVQFRCALRLALDCPLGLARWMMDPGFSSLLAARNPSQPIIRQPAKGKLWPEPYRLLGSWFWIRQIHNYNLT